MTRQLLRLIPAAPLAAAALALATPAAPAATPRSAAAFRDSVGVNTHVSYFDTAYGRWPQALDKLRELGVTHLRDSAFGNPAPSWRDWNRAYVWAVRLAAARGMRFDMITGRPGSGGGSLDDLLAAVAGPLAGAVEALEAPNEYDVSGDGAWANSLRAYQRQLYAKANANPATRGLPVIGPSLVNPGSRAALGDLSGALDAGNLHPYTGGQTPSAARLGGELALARTVSSAKRVTATEAGFHNALAATAGQPPVPEDVAATYTLRTLLENFKAGITRTYLYELLDEKPNPGRTDPEQHFGLLRNDFSEKPAFVALERLLAAVGRPGPLSRPQDLPLRLAGDTAGVAHLLLQRGDGSYVLALWQTGSVWSTAARREIALAPKHVQVGVGRATTATRYEPARSAHGRAVALAAAGSTISLGADPILLELPCACAPARGFVRRSARATLRSDRLVRVALRRTPGRGTARVTVYRRPDHRGAQRRHPVATARERFTRAGQSRVLRLRLGGRAARSRALVLEIAFSPARGAPATSRRVLTPR